MKIGIMQPYFFPYIGYFQLINSVDEFIVYDNIEFTKKGWINRNRILVNDKDTYVSLPLKKDSDFLEIKDRYLAESWLIEKRKILNRITESYRKAPYFNSVFPMIEECILFEENNLFKFIFHSLTKVKNFLDIPTSFVVSSNIEIDHGLKAEKKVIEICKTRNASVYINPIGGAGLYSHEHFKNENINLYFLKPNEIRYVQFGNEFVPWLSIIDVMMFNSKNELKNFLTLISMLK